MALRARLLFLSVLMIVSGCQHLRLTQKRDHVLKRAYDWSDTLHLSDFVLCNTLRNEWNLKKEQEFDKEIDLDSVLMVFQSALMKLNLPLEISNGENSCGSAFRENWRMKIPENNQNIHGISEREKGRLQIIPVIHLNSGYKRHRYIAGGLPGGGYFIKRTILWLTIYVLDGDDIVFLRAGAYFGETYYTYNKGDTRTNLTQEHWDDLVELVMRDYVARLR